MKKILTLSLALVVVAVGSALAADGAAIYKQCAGCHGANADLAPGDSQPLKGQSSDEILKKLQGYADGSYGGGQKKVMENVAKKHPVDEQKAVADHIASMK